jgi:hypothetical protein
MVRLCSLAEPTGPAQVSRAYLYMVSRGRGVFQHPIRDFLSEDLQDPCLPFTSHWPWYTVRPQIVAPAGISIGVGAVSSILCLGGGTGRRKGLKIPWDHVPCGFDSRPRHQTKIMTQQGYPFHDRTKKLVGETWLSHFSPTFDPPFRARVDEQERGREIARLPRCRCPYFTEPYFTEVAWQ